MNEAAVYLVLKRSTKDEWLGLCSLSQEFWYNSRFVKYRNVYVSLGTILRVAEPHLSDAEILLRCTEIQISVNGIEYLLIAKRFNALRCLVDKEGPNLARVVFRKGCQNGCLDFVKELYANFNLDGTAWTSYFPTYVQPGWSKMKFSWNEAGLSELEVAFQDAAGAGHVEILKWIHSITGIRFKIYNKAFRLAAEATRLDAMIWLHEMFSIELRYIDLCINDMVWRAISCGQLGVLQWFHETYGLSDTLLTGRDTLDLAVTYRRLDILKWICVTFVP